MRVFARTPLDISQVIVPRGQVYLIPERCKGCEICAEECPAGAIKMVEESSFIDKEK